MLALLLIMIAGTVLPPATPPPAAAASTHPPEPGRHGAGLTLLGQWVGSWRVPEGSGFCIDFALGHPDSTGAARLGRHRVPGMTTEQSARTAHVASRYGRTRSPVDAAAAALVVWRAQHTRRFDRFYAQLVARHALPDAVRAAVRRIEREARGHGPYRMTVTLGSGLVGQQINGSVRIENRDGHGLSGVPLWLGIASTAALVHRSSRTDTHGALRLRLRVTQPGTVRVRARADAPYAAGVLITRPTRGHQHLVLAGRTHPLSAIASSSQATAHPTVTSVCSSDCAGLARVSVVAANPCGAAPLRVFVLRDGRPIRGGTSDIGGCRRGRLTVSAPDAGVVTTRYCYLNARHRCSSAVLAFPGALRIECPPRPEFRLTAGCPCPGSKVITYDVRGPAGSPRQYRATLTVDGRALVLSVANGQWRSFAPVEIRAGSEVQLSYAVLGTTRVLDRFEQLG